MGKHDNETREEFYARIEKYPDKQDITFVEKRHEYGDVYSFVFRPGHNVDFVPGQFVHLVIHDLPIEAGEPVRYLSIASAPSDKNLQFTTHVRKESRHKQKLGSLKEGDKETIYKIKGEFVLPENRTTPVVLLAGGIGITPYRSMMREEAHRQSKRDLSLVHVSDGEYLFERELSELPFSQHRIGREQIDDYIKTLFKEKEGALFYVSGPPGFVDAMKEKFLAFGIKEENIKQDWFDGYEDF